MVTLISNAFVWWTDCTAVVLVPSKILQVHTRVGVCIFDFCNCYVEQISLAFVQRPLRELTCAVSSACHNLLFLGLASGDDLNYLDNPFPRYVQ